MMTTDRETRTDQKITIERLLGDEQVLVHINPHQPGVIIPPHLMDNRTVTLRLSRFFKGRLATNDEEITAELLFGQNYFVCVIPWTSVWGASSVRGEEFVWAEAAPPEILHMVLCHQHSSQSPQPKSSPASRGTSRTNGSHLRRVK